MSATPDGPSAPSSASAPATGSSARNDDHGHSRLGLALVVIATAQLMVILDASIVNIALPSIQTALDFTPENLTWVINAYTLAFGGLLLLGGRAGDLFGRRRVFVVGIVLFTFASLLCGLATNEPLLIAARVLQGAGAAIASPTALALVTTTFPEGPPRNRAFAVYAAMSGAGAAVGLIAGGVLTDFLDWRWVFFVNVPIGVLLAFLAPRVLGESRPQSGRIDVVGALTGTAGLTVLVYGITRASNPDTGWTDSLTLTCFAVAAVLLVAFVLIERSHQHPIMPLHLYRNRNRSGSYVVMFVVGGAMFAMFYFLGLFIQQIMEYSPVRAGMALLPFTVGIVIGAGTASQLTPRLPPRVIAGVGLGMATIAMLLYAQLEPDSGYARGLLLPMLIMAIGMGLTFVPLTLTAVSGVARDESGIASAVLNTMQQVGGSLGLAVLATFAVQATNSRLEGGADIVATAHFLERAGQQLPPEIAQVLQPAIEATTHGYTTAFLIAAFMMFAGLVLTVVLIDAPKQQVEEGASPVPVG